MTEVLEHLSAALEVAQSLKTGERSEEQRRLAILTTEIEKVQAFAQYVNSSPKN